MPSQNFTMEYESKYELKVQNNKLRAENERLREGLSKIYQLPNDSNIQYAVELVTIMQDIAQQTLNEVKE